VTVVPIARCLGACPSSPALDDNLVALVTRGSILEHHVQAAGLERVEAASNSMLYMTARTDLINGGVRETPRAGLRRTAIR
jgi:hypothetical protein